MKINEKDIERSHLLDEWLEGKFVTIQEIQNFIDETDGAATTNSVSLARRAIYAHDMRYPQKGRFVFRTTDPDDNKTIYTISTNTDSLIDYFQSRDADDLARNFRKLWMCKQWIKTLDPSSKEFDDLLMYMSTFARIHDLYLFIKDPANALRST